MPCDTLNALPPAHAGLQDKSYEGNNKGYIEQKGRQWSNQGDFILLFTVLVFEQISFQNSTL